LAGRLALEHLEARELLSVQFTPSPLLTTPAHRPDTPVGMQSDTVEPLVSVSPNDPGKIAISAQSQMSVSTNNGRNFSSPADFPSATPGTDGDTAQTYDSTGRLFWVNLRNDSLTGKAVGIDITQIDPSNGMIMFDKNAKVDTAPAGSTDDREFLAADPTSNDLYVSWTRFTGATTDIMLKRSTDQGKTWSTAVPVSAPGEGFVLATSISVAPNHRVFVAYHSQGLTNNCTPDGRSGQVFVAAFDPDPRSNSLFFQSKTKAFGPAQADVPWNIQATGCGRKIPHAQFLTAGSDQPWVLADPTRPGSVYVIAATDPNAGTPFTPTSSVVFARSTDSGIHWTTSTISNGSASFFNVFPTAAIDRFGNIVVAFYRNSSLTNSAGHVLVNVFATYSVNGGNTFATPFLVNDPGNTLDPDIGAGTYTLFPGTPKTTRIGDYFGVNLYGGTAYVAWNTNLRNATGARIAQEVWYNTFAIRGKLTVLDNGPGTITLRSQPNNPDFMEVIVNGVREYAGLWSALTGITISSGSSNVTIDIENTVAGVPVVVNTLFDHTVKVSDVAHRLDNIQGPLTITAQLGQNSLTVNDQNNPPDDKRIYTLTANSLTRTAFPSFETARSVDRK
jgi:hypothetical protein